MFFPWLIERIMDKVEAEGKNRSGHAVAQYMNKRYGSQLMSQAIVQYKRGEHTPRGSQAVELIEAAGLEPFTHLPFAEVESVFADKRSSVRQKYYWAFIAGYWASEQKLETPWLDINEGEGRNYMDYLLDQGLDFKDDPVLKEGGGLSIPDFGAKWLGDLPIAREITSKK